MTSGGKPYCAQHLERLPYARAVVEQVQERERELRRVEELGPATSELSEVVVGEMLEYLTSEGPRTLPRLACDLRVSVSIVEAYVGAMVRQGRVRMGRTPRGSAVVRAA
jgi:hypothetical protein